MEMALIEIEETCLLCQEFPGCPVYLKIARALEMFEGYKIGALFCALPKVCKFFGKYQEDPYVRSEAVEYRILRKVAEAEEENKIISIGKIRENGTGSRITSAFLQGIYDSSEEAEIFTSELDVSLLKSASRQPSLVVSPHPIKE